MAKLTSIDADSSIPGSMAGQSGRVGEKTMDELSAATGARFGLDDGYKGRKVTIDEGKLYERNVYVNGDTKDAKIAISAYKNLRTRVMLRMKEIGATSLMVCGASQNVGKTLTSINLALAFARRSEKQVILVDMDLRSPSLHHVMGFKSTGCILDVAEGRKKFNDILVDPGIENLLVVPGSDRHEDSSEAIISTEMQALMKALHSREDTIIVYDTPPVMGCDDVAAVSPYMQAALFVVNERTTTKKELTQSLAMLTDLELLGITMNRSSEGNFSSYYY